MVNGQQMVNGPFDWCCVVWLVGWWRVFVVFFFKLGSFYGVNWRIFWKVKAIENGFQLDGTLPSRLIYEMLPDEIFGGSYR